MKWLKQIASNCCLKNAFKTTNKQQGDFKVVLVGDNPCIRLMLKTMGFDFPKNETVLLPEISEVSISVRRGQPVQFTLKDSNEGFNSLRPVIYQTTDLVLLCYVVEHLDSCIEDLWKEEIRRFCVDVPLVLVGFKARERLQSNDRLGSPQPQPNLPKPTPGLMMASKMKAVELVELSPRNTKQVKALFHLATQVAMRSRIINRARNGTQCKRLWTLGRVDEQ